MCRVPGCGMPRLQRTRATATCMTSAAARAHGFSAHNVQSPRRELEPGSSCVSLLDSLGAARGSILPQVELLGPLKARRATESARGCRWARQASWGSFGGSLGSYGAAPVRRQPSSTSRVGGALARKASAARSVRRTGSRRRRRRQRVRRGRVGRRRRRRRQVQVGRIRAQVGVGVETPSACVGNLTGRSLPTRRTPSS